ncbi:peptidylprolyl isomerase [Nocardioides sp. W7]|uniref:peptidylprolyl isomerase n=1 Tax=Nocardioides sp. W7 TaxID=2931390 RepID=UPI001FD1419D|nr:peptidylprolyl isomerase [Nocardioides sp. W7]
MSSLKRPFAVLAVLASVSLLAGCGDDESSSAVDSGSSDSSSSPSASSEREGTGVACDYPEDSAGAAKEVEPPPTEADVSGDVPITIATSIGDLQATLDAAAAPCTVNSFVSLAEQAYFDSTTCHRITSSPGFGVLQCGDPTGTGTGGPGYTIPDELEETKSYPAGTLAMANTGQPDTGGSQFFICYTDTQLPPSYTVFGTLDEASNGLVADAAAAGTADGSEDGAPKTPVEIKSVTLD